MDEHVHLDYEKQWVIYRHDRHDKIKMKQNKLKTKKKKQENRC